MSGYFPVDACRDQSPPPSYMVSTANQCRKEYMSTYLISGKSQWIRTRTISNYPRTMTLQRNPIRPSCTTLLCLPLKCCHNLILNSSLSQNRLPRSDFRITLRRIILSAHSCCCYVMVNCQYIFHPHLHVLSSTPCNPML